KIGGNLVPIRKWPWQVFLRIIIPTFNSTTMERGMVENGCGGTVISDQWILTAAHCIQPVSRILVYSGIVHRNRSEAEKSEKKIIYFVETAFSHPHYENETNDIALLKLEEPLSFDETVSPICLPHKDQSIPSDGQAVIVGYGTSNIREDSGNATLEDGKLRDTIVPLIKYNTCKTRIETALKYTGVDATMHICAGSMGHGAALGDSGGPMLMKAEDGRWFQIGITSFGGVSKWQTLQDESPGIYTNVRQHCDWIKQTTSGEASCEEEIVK
ncbi:hypothetical protein PFISCL1PPCAC_5259, partial [Pristionchus fissidentatus]